MGGACADLVGGRGDGVADPCAEAGVAGLVDGEVVGACGEEAGGWVEGAVVEDGVCGDGEEVGEGREEAGCLFGGEGGHFFVSVVDAEEWFKLCEVGASVEDFVRNYSRRCGRVVVVEDERAWTFGEGL